jgi:hypothetical protein
MVVVLALLGTAALVVWIRLGGLKPPQPKEIKQPDSENSRAGREIRYNATISLAAIGSKKVRLDLLAEMLDEDKQLRFFWVKLQDGRTVSDEAAARQAILNTLKAIVAWHRKLDVARTFGEDNPKVQKVYAAIRRLRDSSNAVLQKQAQEALEELHLS